MSTIKRFPADEEIEEAANKAIDYLIEIGIIEKENVDLQLKITEAIESYFLPLEDEGVAGYIHPNHLLVIENQRYWLTEQEMKEVEKIQQDYPNGWGQLVLNRMKTLSL
ncbi:MAG: hypothetical protein HC820_01030 [Hydrococcus sp. RM1_1_31]|nr:hypothetical protein [Hydrococcus sp. RM1_1_31]